LKVAQLWSPGIGGGAGRVRVAPHLRLIHYPPPMLLLALAILAQPEPTLHDLGIKISHDYAAEFVALAPRPAPEEAAWPRYFEAYQQLGCLPEGVADCPKPGDPGWPETREFISTRQEAIRAIHDAARHPALGYPVATVDDPIFEHSPCHSNKPPEPAPTDEPPQVLDLRFAYIGTLRALTRALHADAMLALEQGDGQRLADDLEAMLSIARHCSEHPVEVADICSLAITGLTLNVLERVLREQPGLLPTHALKPLIDQLLSAPMQGHARMRTTQTRYVVLDVLQRGWADDGKGDGRFTSRGVRVIDELGGSEPSSKPGMAALLLLGQPAGRRATLEEFDRIMSQPEWTAPFWELERWPDVEPAEREAQRKWRVKFGLLGIIMLDLPKGLRSTIAIHQRRDAARASLALELYRREHNGYPESLDVVAPLLNNELPRDQFTGRTLPYRLIDGVPHLYSFGPDLDDDNARHNKDAATITNWHPPKARKDSSNPPPDGDWVLFTLKAPVTPASSAVP